MALGLDQLDVGLLAAGDPVISEFLAINGNNLPDEDGEFSDWIELQNVAPGPVNLDVPFNLFKEEADVEVPDPAAWRVWLRGCAHQLPPQCKLAATFLFVTPALVWLNRRRETMSP